MSTSADERPSVDYDQRIVRLGTCSYRLSPIESGWTVIDGFGGRSIGSARCTRGEIIYEGEDVTRTEQVLRAWLEHCGAQKREAWEAPPRSPASRGASTETRSAFEHPIPLDALRDLLGLVRAMWRAAKASKAMPEELARHARIGADLAAAIELARSSRPGTAAYVEAWKKAERATARVADLVSCIDSAEPIVKAAVVAVERRGGRRR